MYIIKNAVKNIGRNKGRNILMAVIIFAIILTTAVSIIINTTTAEIIKDYKTRFGSEVSITYDYTNMDAVTEYRPLTAEQLISFGESEYLQSKIITQTVQITFDGLRALDDDKQGIMMGGSISADGSVSGESEYLKVLGCLIATNKPNISKDFENGLREIIDGEIYSGKDTCLVSEQFADLNDLSVGDTITVTTYLKSNPMEYTLTISGIYADYTMLEENQPDMYKMIPSAASNRHNEILVSSETAENMEMANDPTTVYVEATYYLKDPGMIDDYREELTEKGLPKFYLVTTDEAGYQRIVGPVEGLSKVTNTFLIVVLVLGSAILILLSTLAIRERKYEIGVLRAMGMKKGKVALGLLCEMLVITSLCLVLGLGVGSVASQPVADSLLADQIEQAENTVNDNGVIMVAPMGQEQETLAELDIRLNAAAVIQIVLISLGLAGVSSLAGILYITKYEPMKILSERN